MAIDLKALAAEAAKMTPEEREALAQVFGAGRLPAGEAMPEVDPQELEALTVDMKKMYPKLPLERIRQMATKNIVERAGRKREAKPPRAERVYFFLQVGRVEVTEISATEGGNTNVLKKTGYALPDRVIAVDEKTAARLYYKSRNRYGLVCRGDGQAWARARMDGMSTTEAYAVEFEAAKKAGDRTPPPSRERTFMAGTKPAAIAQGREISWSAGLKQNRTDLE